jgi:hypothetical protein
MLKFFNGSRALTLIKVTQRGFPRGIYKEQKMARESKYNFRESNPERRIEEQNIKSRRELEEFKMGEHAFSKF